MAGVISIWCNNMPCESEDSLFFFCKFAWQGEGQVTVLNPGSFMGKQPVLKTIPAEEHARKKFQLHSLLYRQPIVGSLE